MTTTEINNLIINAESFISSQISNNKICHYAFDLLHFILGNRVMLLTHPELTTSRDNIKNRLTNLLNYVSSDDFEMTDYRYYNEDETFILLSSCQNALHNISWKIPYYCKLTRNFYNQYFENV